MGLIAFWHFIQNPTVNKDAMPSARVPHVTACDSLAEPVTERILGSLARLDCSHAEIRVCDFTESTLVAEETTSSMPAHMMRVSAEVNGERLTVVGNGRGADASQTAFDSLFNNLKILLEERGLCG